MFRRLLYLVAALCLASPAVAQSNFHPRPEHGVTDQYIVVFRDGATRAASDRAAGLPTVEELADRLTRSTSGSVSRTWDRAVRGALLEIPEPAARALARNPLVAYVEQDARVVLDSIDSCYTAYDDPGGPGEEEDDPILRTVLTSPQKIRCDDPDPRNGARECIDNWGLDRIDQEDPLALTPRDTWYYFQETGKSGSTRAHVYLIDTGIHTTHSEFDDLATSDPTDSRVKRGVNAAVDESNNFRDDVEDCTGNGHGTHVAAIVGGNTFGVAKEVYLHPVKFLDECHGLGGDTSDIVEAIQWILDTHGFHSEQMGPAIVNLSGANLPGSSLAIRDSVGNLVDGGIAFVQSAGNQKDVTGGTEMNACDRSVGAFSELRDRVLVVAGSDEVRPNGSPRDGRWIREMDDPSYPLCAGSAKDCGSNSGQCVDLWAPAAHIVSASNTGIDTACRLSGTSMAAPHVTGAAALYLAQDPGASPATVRKAILATAACNVMDTDPSSPYFIGDGSPNLLLNTGFQGAPGNGFPETTDDHFWTPVGTSVRFETRELLADDFDPDGDTLSVGCRVSEPEHGTLSIVGIAPEGVVYRYTPDAGFEGVDSFRFRVLDGQGGGDVTTVSIHVTSGSPVMGESGTVTVSSARKEVVLSRTYDDPVVFALPASYNGSNTSLVRITDVQSDRFTLYIHEAPDMDGGHTNETVGYVVLESGAWTLADGTRLEVGRVATSSEIGIGGASSWKTVFFFRGPFGAAPAILSQVQSEGNAHWVTTRQRNPGVWSFELALQEDQASSTAHGPEVVGFLGMEHGTGSWSGSDYEVGQTTNSVTDAFSTISFSQSFAQAPAFVASLASTDGGDSAHLRYQSLTPSSVQVRCEEDTTADSETTHTSEIVTYLAIEPGGTLTATPDP